jgi:hypothetical protein
LTLHGLGILYILFLLQWTRHGSWRNVWWTRRRKRWPTNERTRRFLPWTTPRHGYGNVTRWTAQGSAPWPRLWVKPQLEQVSSVCATFFFLYSLAENLISLTASLPIRHSKIRRLRQSHRQRRQRFSQFNQLKRLRPRRPLQIRTTQQFKQQQPTALRRRHQFLVAVE